MAWATEGCGRVEPRKLSARAADCQTMTLLALPSVGNFRDGLSVPTPRRRATLSGPDGRRVRVALPTALPPARCGRGGDGIPLGRRDPSRERGDAPQARVRSIIETHRRADLRRG